MYSETVRRLLAELPNRGELSDATHSACSDNAICGDTACLFLMVDKGRVTHSRFQAHGCPGAVAAAAAITLLVSGRTAEECRLITKEVLLSYLGGLPSHRLHGAELAVTVLRKALLSA